MTLNLQGLKDDLYVAFTLGEDVNPESEQNLQEQIDAIAMAIDAYVRSGTVETNIVGTIAPGLAATAAGTPPVPQPNAAPIPVNGTGLGSII